VTIIVNIFALIAFIINIALRILAQAGIAVKQFQNFQYGKPGLDDASLNSVINSLAII
jgi:hypothetical protein